MPDSNKNPYLTEAVKSRFSRMRQDILDVPENILSANDRAEFQNACDDMDVHIVNRYLNQMVQATQDIIGDESIQDEAIIAMSAIGRIQLLMELCVNEFCTEAKISLMLLDKLIPEDLELLIRVNYAVQRIERNQAAQAIAKIRQCLSVLEHERADGTLSIPDETLAAVNQCLNNAISALVLVTGQGAV